MRRIRLAFALAAVLAVAAGAFVLSNLRGWTRGWIEQGLARALDAEVRIGRLDLDLLRLRIGISDLVAETAPGSPRSLRLVVPAGSVRLAWRALPGLRSGRLQLAEVRLERPLLALEDHDEAPAGPASESLPVNLRIGRLTVARGRLIYGDRRVPVSIEADDVDLRGAWAGDRRALLGRLSLASTIERAPFRRPLEVAVDSRLRWRANRVELFELSAEGDGVLLRLDGELSWGEEIVWKGEGRLTFDLERLGGLFGEAWPAISGRGSAEVSLHGRGAAWGAGGGFELEQARWEGFRSATMRGRYAYEAGDWSVDVAEAEAFGGTISGSVAIESGEAAWLSADLEGRALRVRELLADFGVALPLDARGTATLGVEGPLDQPGRWSGGGSFTATAEPSESGVSFDAAGALRLEHGRIRVVADEVRAAAARFALDVTLETAPHDRVVVLLDGETGESDATRRAVLQVLDGLSVEAPEILRQPVSGRGGFRARVETGLDPRAEVELDVHGGSCGPLTFDRLELALIWDGRELILPRVRIGRGEERMEASARLGLEPFLFRELRLRAGRFSVDTLLTLLGVESDLRGKLAGQLDLERGPSGPSGEGWLVLTEGGWFGERFERAEARVEVTDGVWRFHGLEVSGPAIQGEGTLVWSADRSRAELDLHRATVDTRALEQTAKAELSVSGKLELAGRLSLDPQGTHGELRFETDGVEAGGYATGGFRGLALLRPEEVTLALSGQGWSGDARVEPAGDWPLTAELRLDEFQTELGETETEPVSATLSGGAAIRGSLLRPAEMTVDGRLDRIAVGLGPRRFSASDVPVRLAANLLHAGPVRLSGPAGEVEGEVIYEVEGGAISGDCAGHLDLGLIGMLLPEARGSGRMAIDVGLGGTLEAPELRGSIRLAGARFRHLGIPQVLDQVEARAEFAGERIHIRDFRALAGGGELLGEGELIVDLDGVRSHRLELVGRGVRVEWPEGFDGVYDAWLVWAGTRDESTIGGELFLLRGLYTKDFEIGGLVAPAAREYGGDEAQQLPENVLLDIELVADGNLWVRNDLVESEARLDLEIGGELRRPELAGRISLLEDGKIRYRNVEYRIVSTTVDFTDPEQIHPYVSMNAQTSIGRYDIILRIEGYADRFEYELTSTPTLSQQDIIALLATGRTLEELGERGETGFTGDLAASYFAGALTGKFEKQIQALLKLERFRIDPLLYEGRADPTTRITVGKEVADGVLVVVSSDLGASERQLYQIEWQASRRLRLTAQRDTTGGIGGDLFYTGRLAGRGRAPSAQARAASAPVADGGAGESVVEVRLEGIAQDDADAVRRRLRLAPGDRFRRSALFAGVEAIRRFYVEQGRLQADVRGRTEAASSGGEGIAVVYAITPGPRFRVELEGARKKEQRPIIARLQELWRRQLFTEDFYTDSEERVADYYRDRGFYAASVQHALEEEEDGLLLRFEIDPGKPVHVASVSIDGAAEVSEERIRRQILTRPQTLFSRRTLDVDVLEQDVRAIRNLYRDLGYLEAEVARPRIRLSSAGDSADVTIQIDEGPRFVIGSMRFGETAAFSEQELLSWTGLAVGGPFSTSELLEAESAVRAEADRLGYPDARTRSAVSLGRDTVDVEFTLQSGGLKVVDSIVYTGNERTREKVLRRALALEVGEPISRAKILETQHRLYRLGVFSNVRITYAPSDAADPTKQRVEVRVEEAPPVSVTVGLGYDTEAKGRASFAVSHDNLGGSDRKGRFEAQASGILQRVQLLGREPDLFGSRLPATMTLFWEDREETGFNVERAAAALRVDHKFGPKWKGFARYSLQNVDITDVTDPTALQGEKLENVELGDVGVTFVRDTRDDPLAPTRGNFFSWNGRLFARPLLSESSFVKSTLTGAKRSRIGGGTAYVAAIRLALAQPFGSTEQVPISERFFAGGDSTLRGFGRDEVGPRENDLPVGGEAMFLVNQELHYPIWRQLRGVLFYDAGNVYEKVSEVDLSDLRHVLGVGLRLETPIGPIRLEYGRKLDREPDESRGELFLAIGTIF